MLIVVADDREIMNCECRKFRPFSCFAIRSVFNPKLPEPREEDSCLGSAGGGLQGLRLC